MKNFKIDVKQYLNLDIDSDSKTNVKYQLMLDDSKIKLKNVCESDNLRDAVKHGRTITRKENDKFKDEIRSYNTALSKVEGYEFDQFVNFVDHDILLAFNTVERYSVCITRNGSTRRKLFTSKMAAKTTRDTNKDYNGFIFKLDAKQSDLEVCSKSGKFSTLSQGQKLKLRAEDYKDFKDAKEVEHTKEDYLQKMTREERIELMIAIANFEFGTDKVVKGFVSEVVKTQGTEKAVKQVSSTLADLKRSITQSENIKKRVLQPEASNTACFNAKLPVAKVETKIEPEAPQREIEPKSDAPIKVARVEEIKPVIESVEWDQVFNDQFVETIGDKVFDSEYQINCELDKVKSTLRRMEQHHEFASWFNTIKPELTNKSFMRYIETCVRQFKAYKINI